MNHPRAEKIERKKERERRREGGREKGYCEQTIMRSEKDLSEVFL